MNIIFHNDDSIYRTILVDLRIPRVLIGLLVGACLAVSGAILQGVMRNPLADPGIIGVTAGGGMMAKKVVTPKVLMGQQVEHHNGHR